MCVAHADWRCCLFELNPKPKRKKKKYSNLNFIDVFSQIKLPLLSGMFKKQTLVKMAA